VTRLESEQDPSTGSDGEHTREVLRHYVPMFEDKSPVLELGCGRGQFLGLLDDKGIKAEGIDPDQAVAEAARARGLEVHHADPVAFLHGEPAPGPYQGVFCDHLVEHLAPDQVGELLAGVRRVLGPGGRFVAVTPNPACYAVLSHDFWRDPGHVRLYDLPLLERLCRQAGLQVESSGTNPVNHPGPPPEYLVPEPVVHPPLDDLVERAMGKLRASLDHYDRKGRVTQPHDPQWAYELAHVVKVLSGRLQETTEALREVRRAHDKLVWGLYQSNETYVVARG
jgi:SAM-dependent methyltransferase